MVKPGICNFLRDNHVEIKRESSILYYFNLTSVRPIFNSYSLKWRSIVVDICLAAKRWGKYSQLLIVLVYTKQKTKKNISVNISKKVLEIKLLTRKFVTLAARRWVLFANHFNQRTQKVLVTCVVYTNTLYVLLHSWL